MESMARESAPLAFTRRLFSLARSTACSMVSGPSTRGRVCAHAKGGASTRPTTTRVTAVERRRAPLMTAMTGMFVLLISFGLDLELRRCRPAAGRRNVDLQSPGARRAQVHGRFVRTRLRPGARRGARPRHSWHCWHPRRHLYLGSLHGSPRGILHLDPEAGLTDSRAGRDGGEADLEIACRCCRC